MYLAGDKIGEANERGVAVHDSDFMLLINAHHEPIPFQVPGFRGRVRWRVAIDTTDPELQRAEKLYARGSVFPLQGRSLVLLQQSFRPGASGAS
jgi:glycogen operon protein